MAKRCSHCNSDNHNLRTCPNRGVRLFGVRLTDGSIQKSASTGNLAIFARSAAASGSSRACPQDPPIADEGGSGYVSEGFNGGSASRERKKGVPWTEQEHKMFLLGLKKLGKGDWRGISRNFVISRTPTQVASHAQKYFIRHSANNRRKRRVSLFDIVADEPATANNAHLSSDHSEHEAQPAPDVQSDSTKDQDYCTPIPPTTIKYSYPPPVYPLFLPLPNEASSAEAEGSCAPVYPAFFFPPDVPFSIPCWTGCTAPTTALPSHEIVKPTAVHSKSPIDAGELFSMSKLTLGPLQQLVGSSERRSAFHARETAGSSRLDSGSSPIHAV